MPGIVICEMDLSRLMLAKYRPEVITDVGPTKVKLSLEENKIIEIVDGDPLLQQKMVDAGQVVFRKAGDDLATMLQEHDTMAQRAMAQPNATSKMNQITDIFKKKLEIEGRKAGKEADKAAAKVWTDLVRTRSEYKKYKWKTGFQIVLGFFGVGAAVAGAVVASPTGVGAAAAAYGAYQSAITAYTKVRAALKSATEVYTKLDKDLKKALVQYEEYDRKSLAAARRTAQEVLSAASEKFMGIQRRSLASMENDLTLFRNKLRGADVEAHTVSAEMGKALAKWDLAAAELRRASPAVQQRAHRMPDLGSKITDAITKITTLMEMINKGATDSASVEATINKLKEGVNTTVITAARSLFGTATGAIAIFSGGVPDMENTFTVLKVGFVSAKKAKELYEELGR